jgi:hypothetical protein
MFDFPSRLRRRFEWKRNAEGRRYGAIMFTAAIHLPGAIDPERIDVLADTLAALVARTSMRSGSIAPGRWMAAVNMIAP